LIQRHLGALVFVSLLAASSSVPASADTEFYDGFDGNRVIEEAFPASSSSSPDWWVNSGGRLKITGGYGRTIQGDLPASDPWRLAYASANPVDTDDGYHPQNLLRLVSRSLWTNFRQGVYFQIRKTNLSSSPNRSGSNGILLFSRYVDSQNLYYAGVRVDGTAVIKKKLAGVYYTLAQVPVFPGTYNRSTQPNLLPLTQWVGLKSRIATNSDGSVKVQLYLDRVDGAGWKLVLEALDTGALGGSPIRSAGSTGIRTDFMDVFLDRYTVYGN
jgi:hypothetical protein